MQKRIPFIPLSQEKLKKLAHHYIGWGEMFSKGFPHLSSELKEIGFNLSGREWLAIAFFSLFTYTFMIMAMVVVLGVFVVEFAFTRALSFGILLSFPMGFAIFFYMIFYPKMLLRRKIRDIEKNIAFALHHLLIQIRSGVPMFFSLISLARSNYGELSVEIRKAINQINTGKSEIEALEMMARNNPSLGLRRVLWQIVNAMKSGSDIGNTLKEIVDNIAIEQRVAIKKYGSELNPLALFYMMFVVIFPTLGIVFILVLFSFLSAPMDLQIILSLILVFLVVFQVVFMGLIKSKRPGGV